MYILSTRTYICVIFFSGDMPKPGGWIPQIETLIMKERKVNPDVKVYYGGPFFVPRIFDEFNLDVILAVVSIYMHGVWCATLVYKYTPLMICTCARTGEYLASVNLHVGAAWFCLPHMRRHVFRSPEFCPYFTNVETCWRRNFYFYADNDHLHRLGYWTRYVCVYIMHVYTET